MADRDSDANKLFRILMADKSRPIPGAIREWAQAWDRRIRAVESGSPEDLIATQIELSETLQAVGKALGDLASFVDACSKIEEVGGFLLDFLFDPEVKH